MDNGTVRLILQDDVLTAVLAKIEKGETNDEANE